MHPMELAVKFTVKEGFKMDVSGLNTQQELKC